MRNPMPFHLTKWGNYRATDTEEEEEGVSSASKYKQKNFLA